ncbi:MAG: hypothetical protein BMS9Abin01_0385 [Gammaproteobacteria bacterium]|nr:MAG: hypothetical protein BMS9Abin01_0385 [Gammaproteobacteria bacterium]
MAVRIDTLDKLIEQACSLGPIRVAVVDAAQGVVMDTVYQAQALGIIEPRLIGDPRAIADAAEALGREVSEEWLIPAATDPEAAAMAARLVRAGQIDAVMKGQIHTDVLMRALLDKDHGLRLPGRRVSHVFVTEVATRDKLLGISDAAINITPDLTAKAQILQNAVELFQLLGVETPKVAVLSAVETINPDIPSTLDAASLTMMARRGQINGALVDGPLAFDNAISEAAAAEKGIVSEVAGAADIVLVPDLVSGNILAKNLEYLAGATAAGVVVGLAAPAVLSSRADPPASRIAALALVSLMHHLSPAPPALRGPGFESSLPCAPQPEHACCPVPEY